MSAPRPDPRSGSPGQALETIRPGKTNYIVVTDQRCAMCSHRPLCPPADHRDRGAARTVASHPEQGWSLLCNGVIVFDDMGEILPGGRVNPPHCPAHAQLAVAA